MGNLVMSESLGLDAFEGPALELRPEFTESDLQAVIRAVYKQVLGNEYVMDSQRLESAESLLRDGSITVRDFVRIVAQSPVYRELFFHTAPQYRFIELNFKHLLGRAPQDQAEIDEHVRIYYEEGYEAEINSYIDSAEYAENFGTETVPFPRSIRSQAGIKTAGFNRMFSLLRGPATSDRDSSSRLITALAANTATAIKAPAQAASGSYDSTGKRFRIVFSTASANARLNRLSKQETVISYGQMSPTVQKIHRVGGQILSITEVA